MHFSEKVACKDPGYEKVRTEKSRYNMAICGQLPPLTLLSVKSWWSKQVGRDEGCLERDVGMKKIGVKEARSHSSRNGRQRTGEDESLASSRSG